MAINYKLLTTIVLVKFITIVTTTSLFTERVEVNYYNPKYCTNVEINCFPYNRTLRMVNGTVNLLKSFTREDAYVQAKAYIFLVNRYVLTGIQGQMAITTAYKSNVFGVQELLKKNVIPPITKYPVPSGNYTFFNLHASLNIPNIPDGRYKVVVSGYEADELGAKLTWYGKVQN